jgi:hypothetical protein
MGGHNHRLDDRIGPFFGQNEAENPSRRSKLQNPPAIMSGLLCIHLNNPNIGSLACRVKAKISSSIHSVCCLTATIPKSCVITPHPIVWRWRTQTPTTSQLLRMIGSSVTAVTNASHGAGLVGLQLHHSRATGLPVSFVFCFASLHLITVRAWNRVGHKRLLADFARTGISVGGGQSDGEA